MMGHRKDERLRFPVRDVIVQKNLYRAPVTWLAHANG